MGRQVGISEHTYYRWKKVYGGIPPSEARELKQLREENAKLKRLAADLSLDKVMLQDALKSQYALTPFVEIRITPVAPFRIGVPVQRTVTFGKTSKVALAPALQLVVQLSGAK